MTENIDNKDEINLIPNAKKKKAIPHIINKYNPFKMKKTDKKHSITSIIVIFFEISFILIAFFLSLKRVILTFIPKKETKIYTLNAKEKDIKLCLCTPLKNENRYIIEFVQFYKQLGVDKIFLYDNNDEKGENLNDVVNDYVKSGLVEVSDWRGKSQEIAKMMDDCYQKNNKKYDWLIFYEVDEYIHLKDYINIKSFLNDKKFEKCQKIYLNWVFHTDNNLFHYDKKPLQQRFPIPEPIPLNNYGKNNYVKSIIRGNITNFKIENSYWLDKNINGCNGYGKEVGIKLNRMKEQDFKNYYIDHYFCKSVDEFIEKINWKDEIWGYNNKFILETVDNYFSYNIMTIEKIEYIEKKTGLNLSEYKAKLKNKKKNK